MASASEDEQFGDWPATSSAPTTPSRRGGVSVASSDYEPDYDDNGYALPDPDAAEPSQGFATQTAFDAYFLHASKPARTSANVFSHLVPPLTPEEHAAALAKVHEREQKRVLWRDPSARRTWFRRIRMELGEGFNVLLYGCGSKREFLNSFAEDMARRGNHVVVANGFNPSFTFKDLFAAIEQIPGVLDHTTLSSDPSGGGGQDAQTQRIHTFFSSRDSPHLYLVAHNIDGNAFRAPKNRAGLTLLALAPHIHVVASVDHVAAPTRWSLSEIFARKPDPASGNSAPAEDTGIVPRRGFAWLWHDLTTLAPYDFELAYADPTALAGVAALRGTRPPTASAAALAATGGASGGQAAVVTETAARHVLASVTVKAKKLFVLLGTKQLEVMDAPPVDKGKKGAKDDAGEVEGDKEKEKEREGAYDYDRLFAAARDNFVATNDTALRALLGEFRDHGLVVTVTTAAAGAEAMWIPVRREALLKIVGELKAEGH